jgi:hypothetical protein
VCIYIYLYATLVRRVDLEVVTVRVVEAEKLAGASALA